MSHRSALEQAPIFINIIKKEQYHHHIVCFEYETLSLTLREEYKSSVSEHRIIKRVLESKRVEVAEG
jgi:hypothetical protein